MNSEAINSWERMMSAKPEVEALLFDLGGVVIHIDFGRALRRWAPMSSLSLEEVTERFSMDAPYERHERGEIEASEYFAHLRNVLNLDASDEDIADAWNAIYVGEFTEALDSIDVVRAQIPCFAFTNTNATHQVKWKAAYPRVVATFDRVFASSEIGLRKPERAAFKTIEESIGVPSSATLFFDDSLENVEGARAAGLRAVHVHSPADVVRVLSDL